MGGRKQSSMSPNPANTATQNNKLWQKRTAFTMNTSNIREHTKKGERQLQPLATQLFPIRLTKPTLNHESNALH